MKEERYMYWNPEVLTRIDAADDLKIAPYHPDMNTTGTPTWIWEVKVDNRLFVRAYSGIRSKWYQAALSQQAGKILAIGQEFDVLAEQTGFGSSINLRRLFEKQLNLTPGEYRQRFHCRKMA
ncbi:DUF2255 family protein [Klebsiella pneumoniae]